MGRLLTLLLALGLCACGATPGPPPIPTAAIRLASPAPMLARVRTSQPPAPTEPPLATPTLAAPAGEALGQPLDQYRAWMAEARALHPYPDPVELMWAVMICESSGDADVVAGANQGLFQYDTATWAGDWNPYRDQPIRDPRAQIFATAKAWADGNQRWWGCYHG